MSLDEALDAVTTFSGQVADKVRIHALAPGCGRSRTRGPPAHGGTLPRWTVDLVFERHLVDILAGGLDAIRDVRPVK